MTEIKSKDKKKEKPKKTTKPIQPTDEKTNKEAALPAVKEEIKRPQARYFYAVGRRKEAVARIKFWPEGKGEIVVNGKDYKTYFPYFVWTQIVEASLKLTDHLKDCTVRAAVKGGGISAQAESIRHALSRALVKLNPELRSILKKAGYLTRDPREKERKKYGLKRARRAPQWSKR